MATEFKKLCPQCGNEMYYSNKKSLKTSIFNNTLCKDCKKKLKLKNKVDFRLCPKCGKKILYKSPISIEYAEKLTKEGKLCRSCIGEKSMLNKTVYDIWLKKYGKDDADKKLQEFKHKCSLHTKGENNPNYKNKCNGAKGLVRFGKYCKGKTFEDIYGEKKAKQIKQKISKTSSGKNNGMYGKPPSYKSGSGWSGHYKNIQFRSMLELYYLIYLLDNNIPFENGELKKHRIEYEMDRKKRNYLPDFYLINTDQTIEIKPKALVNTYQNKLKFAAAKQKLGNKHIILTEDDIQNIDIEKLYDLYQKNYLVFDKKYIEKFENFHRKKGTEC